jgi:hypothetical protein
MAIDFNAPSQVRPYANLGAFPATGAVKTIYIAEDTNYIYRWNGTAYIEISVADLVGYVPYTGATQDVNLGAYDAYVSKLWLYDAVNDNYGSTHYTDGNYHIEDADGHKLLVIEDGFMQIHKTDTIQSNLYTSGLTATRDHYLPDASGTIALTSDLAGYVPTSRTLTINGTTQDLSADRTFTISTGITIGTTPITSGTDGRILFQNGGVVSQSANLFFDVTNGRLGINTSTPTVAFEVKKTIVGGVEGIKVELNHNSSTAAATLDFIHTNFDARARIQSIAGAGGANPTLSFIIRSTTAMNIFQSGNIGVNQGTDAGFKADVNGTMRVQGQVNIQSASLLTISSALTAYADVTFSVNGASGGYQGGYTFKSGAGGNAGNTALKISSPSTTVSYVGIGNFTTLDIGAGTGKLHIENTIATGRNAGIKLRVGFGDIVNQYNGIQFDTIELGGGGAFIGSQRNTASSGYGSDLVVLTTLDLSGANAYNETARFIGRYNSFYVGTDKTLAVPSAKMQIQSTTQGFLPPRMTTAQKNAIASPVAGLQVYDTTLNLMSYYNGTIWI